MGVKLCTLAVAVLTLLIGGYGIVRHPEKTTDGYNYAVRMQLDAGVPYARARAGARAVYAKVPSLQGSRARASLDAPYPQWWHLFAVRVIAPWLASRLWPFFGFFSPLVVSAASYVAVALLSFALFLRFASPERAALCAVTIAILPSSRWLGRSDLTDTLADAFWVATLLFVLRYAERDDWRNLLGFGCCALLLAFTRPVPYMPLCAAVPLAFYGSVRRAALLGFSAGLLCVAVLLVMRANGAHVPPFPHYAAQLGRAARVTVGWAAGSFGAVVALAALLMTRQRPASGIMLGALASTAVTLLVDPLAGDMARVAIFPMLPVLGCGLAIVLESIPVGTRAAQPAGGAPFASPLVQLRAKDKRNFAARRRIV